MGKNSLAIMAALFVGGCSSDGGRTNSDTGNTAGTADAGSVGEAGSADSADASGGSADADGSGGSASADDDSGGEADGGSSGVDDGPGETGGIPKFDLEVPDHMDTDGEEEGCTKVDFLFVVDNSGSMSDNQANLVNNFPGFAQEIEDTLFNVESLHVGVVTTDDYDGNEVGCNLQGALITKTDGLNSSMANCGPGNTLTYAQGDRFMTEADDLPARFMCAGLPGTSGSSQEQHALAITEALKPGMNLAGACNAGFLRPDALLVIVIISDEDDDSPGDPLVWFNQIIASKGDVEENIVFMSIVSTYGTSYPSTCDALDETGEGQIALTEMFTNGFIGDVCAMDYGVVFHDAIDLIDEACDNFQPPG